MPRPENTYDALCEGDLFENIAAVIPAVLPLVNTLTRANKAGAAQAVQSWLGYALCPLVETNDLRTGKWVLESMLANNQTGKALEHYKAVTKGDSHNIIEKFHKFVTGTATQAEIDSHFRGQGDLEHKNAQLIATLTQPIAAYCLHIQQAGLTEDEKRHYNAPYIPQILVAHQLSSREERAQLANQLVNAMSDNGIDPKQGGIALSDYKTLYDLMDATTQATFAAVTYEAIKGHLQKHGNLEKIGAHDNAESLHLLRIQICENGDMDVLTHLLQGPEDLGLLLLHHAEAGNVSVIGKLIEAHAPRDVVNAQGETWLQIAIGKGYRRSFPQNFPFNEAERSLYNHRDVKTICHDLISEKDPSEKTVLGNELIGMIQVHGIGASGFDIDRFSEVIYYLTEPMKPQFIDVVAEAMINHKGQIKGNLNPVAEKLCERGHVNALVIALRGKSNLRTALLGNYCKNGLAENVRTMFAASAILDPGNISKDDWIRVMIENGHDDKLDHLTLTESEKNVRQHYPYQYAMKALVGEDKRARSSAALKMMTIVQRHGIDPETGGINLTDYRCIADQLKLAHRNRFPEFISAVAEAIVKQGVKGIPPYIYLMKDLCEHEKTDALRIVISGKVEESGQLLKYYIDEEKTLAVKTMLAAGAPRIMSNGRSWIRHMIFHNEKKALDELEDFNLTNDERAIYHEHLFYVGMGNYPSIEEKRVVVGKIINGLKKYGIDKTQGGVDLGLYGSYFNHLTFNGHGDKLKDDINRFISAVAGAIRTCPQLNKEIIPAENGGYNSVPNHLVLLTHLCEAGHEDAAAMIAQNNIVSDGVWQELMDKLTKAGQANAIKKLHAAGVPLKTSMITSVFHTAIKNDQLPLLDEIGVTQEHRWPENMPSLLSAAINGNNMKAVLWLNPSQDDWQRKQYKGQSALNELSYIREPIAALPAIGEFVVALLTHAVNQGQNFIIQTFRDEIIEAGDKIYAKDHQGNSLAQAALQKDNVTAFTSLLSKGSGIVRDRHWGNREYIYHSAHALQVNNHKETIIDNLLQVTPEISSDALKRYSSYLNLPLANINGQTVLHGIAKRNDIHNFARMVAAGADSHRLGDDGTASIDALIDRNDVHFLKTLDMTLLNGRDVNHNTPLHRARKFPERFKKMLEVGVDITLLNGHQRLAIETDTGEMVPFFSEIAPTILVRQDLLLHERFKQPHSVDHLVAAGLDVTTLNKGYTPVDHYLINQPPKNIKELEERCPGIYNRPDIDGNTPLHRAIMRSQKGGLDDGLMDKLKELTRHVVNYFGDTAPPPLIDINTLNHEQLTAGDIAIMTGFQGLNPAIHDALDINGNSGLHRAVIRRDIPAIQALCKAGASTLIPDAQRKTAIKQAAGADRTLVNKDGYTVSALPEKNHSSFVEKHIGRQLSGEVTTIRARRYSC